MTRRLRIDDLFALHIPSQPAVHPAGSRVAYVVRSNEQQADRAVTVLWQTDADGNARQLTHGDSDTSPAFSPDGSALAFQRAGQLWTMPADGGEPAQLTHLPITAGEPFWSPDGSRIAFAAPVDAHAAPDETDDDRVRRTAAPIVADGLEYQVDGTGHVRTTRMQLHVVDVASGELRQLTDGDAHVGSPAWSPDGSTLAYVVKPHGADDLATVSAVHTIDATDPKARPVLVAFADGVAATVTYTPDGSGFIVIGWEHEVRGHARLFHVEAATGAVSDLAGTLDRNVMAGAPGYPGARPQFTADGDVLFAIRDRGCTHLYAVPVHGGTPRLVHGGENDVVSGLSVAAGVAVIALATATSFGELMRIELASGAEKVITAHGENTADIALYPRVAREFEISDGVRVEGWMMRDENTTGAGPLLVDVHGGPHNAWNGAVDDMHFYHHELVARGWTVLMLNPRGSDGYGESFYDAVFAAWGEADARDFLEPIDQLIAEGVADPERVAVAGYSYGGFMTCYLTSRTDRFAAAVTGGVVSDLTSLGGTSDDAHLMNVVEIGLMPWRDADRARLAELSPFTHVERVTTPTLVLHGADDVRCPVGQAEQWYFALRENGVPTRMVLYPGGSHMFPLMGKPSHRIDYNTRVAEWVERHAADAAGPRPAPIDAEHWQRRLDRLAAKHNVPGAQLGILRFAEERADDLVVAATGTLNRNVATGAPVTADSIFQIGSISKVWTATVIMRLIEEGKLSLDTKVADVLPGFRIDDEQIAAGVTVWNLLTHTSGIDGDIFTDTGRGDDCLEKYVDSLSSSTPNHLLGATWSYCNSGYSILGRIIEVVTGKTWDTAMKELLFAPLGLNHTVTLAEEAILHAAAVGHIDADGEQVVTPVWGLPRSLGPAGLITARVADVLQFARMHLAGGVAADGSRLLTAEHAAQMQQLQADVPDKYTLGDSWGLGWIRFDWNGARLYGHDGTTLGQAAFLRIHPDTGVAVALLTNGGNTHDFYEDVYREVFAELSGIDMRRPIEPPAETPAVDITPHLGRYERSGVLVDVLLGDQGPRLRTEVTGVLAEMTPDPIDEYDLTPVSQNLYVLREPGTETWMPVTFYALPGGEEYLHFGARATPKQVSELATPR
ncbi:serine hydrolase [Agromyces neolithicus]|uniref:Serine hydrolase n=1 Tax=Agromyces neolithicus TaxID=269420 RepID=A0ABN2M9A5_9MICO